MNTNIYTCVLLTAKEQNPHFHLLLTTGQLHKTYPQLHYMLFVLHGDKGY